MSERTHRALPTSGLLSSCLDPEETDCEFPDGSANVNTPPVQPTKLVTQEERELVSHWLLAATDDRDLARKQWAEQEIALLACGGIFAAVRIPALLVWAAAGTDELPEVDDFLRKTLYGGPVFMDIHAHQYYLLVPASTAWRWNDRDFPGVACLGRDHYLGVPAIRHTTPRGRSYWCVPLDSPAELCTYRNVEVLIRAGIRARRIEGIGR
ncbi:hypothetical protein [Streptomyces vastus]|uniref:DNA primase/polymerase bifunctional N-terminal domain-containing protein n=1 Tax=Streptomyces vastus TaxID=285451 RepID=A0ABP6CQJ8_9ACTN